MIVESREGSHVMKSVDRQSMTFEQLAESLPKLEVFAMLAETTDAYPGPTPAGTEVLRRHLLFLYDLEDRGHLLAAGALDFDASLAGGQALVVLRATDRAEAVQLTSGDPLVEAGWLTYTPHAWQVNEGRLVEPLQTLMSTS